MEQTRRTDFLYNEKETTIFSGVKSSMKIFIAVLFGLISAAVGIWFSFFNPGMGPVMSISIIGAGIIYALWQKKDN